MQIAQAALGFAAIGSEARLEVLRALVRAGEEGLTIGDVRERTGIPASTLAHHLKFLAGANLITQEKIGRSVMNRAAYRTLEDLAKYILQECCADSDQCHSDTSGNKENGHG